MAAVFDSSIFLPFLKISRPISSTSYFLDLLNSSLLPLSFQPLYWNPVRDRSEQGCQGVVQVGPECTQLTQVEPGSKSCDSHKAFCGLEIAVAQRHFAKNHAWETLVFNAFADPLSDMIYLGTVSFPITAAPPAFLLGENNKK